jgi:hypothetical protein
MDHSLVDGFYQFRFETDYSQPIVCEFAQHCSPDRIADRLVIVII